jgi:CubicO group peptidase (beta-lactamase class C family)
MRASKLWLAPALLAAVLPAACQQRTSAPPHLEEIHAAVRRAMARAKIPGLTVAVAREGAVWSQGYGQADIENSVPATPRTVYRLGSISKPITAVAALQLAERGRLDLDAPVQTYVPSFPAKPWPITSRQLLGHLGGIRHYRSIEEVNSTRHYDDLLAPLEIFQNDPLVAEPGTKFSYTTYGYVLLGAVVERAAGVPFLDYLRENIFEPAGMKNIQADSVHAIIPHRARGYRLTRAGALENCELADTSNKIPGGGLSSTAMDLVRFALALKEGKLLKAATLEAMFSPQRLKDGSLTQYGLGWNLLDAAGLEHVLHGGGQQGVSTMLLMERRRPLVVAVMANLEGAPVGDLAMEILDLLRR